MATGTRIPLVLKPEFEQLNEQINDPTTGIATRVESVEQNPTLTLVLPYNEAESYQPGYPVTRNGVILVANKNTTGVFKEADWNTTGGRKSTSPVFVEDGLGNEASLSIESGQVTLTVTDGTDTKTFTYGATSGRVNMPNHDTLENAGDNDAVVKGDIETVVRRAFTLEDVPTEAEVALVDENGNLAFYADVNVSDLFKLTQLNYDDTGKRFTQVDAPVDVATADEDVLTKKDGDELYGGKVSIGYFQESSTKSDDWTTICDLGVIAIQARNPTSTTGIPVRIFNNTGQTLTHIWDIRESDDSFRNGATGNSTGNYFSISAPTASSNASRRMWAQAYYNGNGTQLGGGAWSYEIGVYRIGTDGYRIVAKLQSN